MLASRLPKRMNRRHSSKIAAFMDFRTRDSSSQTYNLFTRSKPGNTENRAQCLLGYGRSSEIQ